MNTKPMTTPFPPLSIQAAGYLIHVFRVEQSPRLWANSPAPHQNIAPPTLHAHRNYEVFFVVSGTLELLTEQDRKIYSDSIVMLPPRIHHVTVRDGESYCLLFSLEQEQLAMPFSPENPGVLPLTEEMIFYIRQLTEKTLLRSVSGEEAVACLAQLIFMDIFQKIPPCPAMPSPHRHGTLHVSKIDEFVNARYASPICLDDLADYLHLSRRQTARVIRQEYQCSFTELLAGRRMTNAAHLLAHTDLPIGQVIQKTFPGSPNYFHRIFQRHFGVSPLQYRKEVQTAERK